MKRLLFLTLLWPALLFGQGQSGGGGGGPVQFAGAATGACAANQTAVDTTTGNYYSCNNGVWLLVGPGAAGSASFATLTAGTNAGQALVVGAGSTLTTASTGSITATSAAKWTTARNLAGNSTDGSANVAFANKFIVQGTTDAGLSGAQFLGALATGILKNTTTTGVLSAAAAADVVALFSTCSGTQYLGADGACHTASGSGNTTSTSLTTNKIPKANGANSIIDSSVSDDGTTVSTSENLSVGSAASTASIGLDTTGGNNSLTTQASATGLTWTLPSTSGTFADSATAPIVLSATTGVLTCPTCIVATVNPSAGVLHVAGSTQTATGSAVVGSDMTNGTVTATQLAAQYSKGSCTEAWAGSGTAFALTAGDDAASNNTCYNDSGVTRTITAVKCRNDNASNTTTVNPTFGSAGTGTTICSGALTCGNSYAYSSTCTVSNASWTTGTGVSPAMSGTLTGTSISLIIEFTY